ncbi:hypothetical protein ACP4OV_007600 [Aristida adscensionis]
MAGSGRGGYSFGYGQIDVAGGRGGRGGHGARVPPVAMPPSFYSPDGLEMPPRPSTVRTTWGFSYNVGEAQKLGIKEAVLAMNAQTLYWFVDFSYLKLHAMEAGEEVMTYLRNFTRHYTKSTYHRRVHVSQSLNYILADAADMIGYDVELDRTQRVLMADGAIWCQVRVRFEGMDESFYIFGVPYPEQYVARHSALLYALLHLQDIRGINIRDVFYNDWVNRLGLLSFRYIGYNIRDVFSPAGHPWHQHS